jgi:predicted Zn-dependent peptidase
VNSSIYAHEFSNGLVLVAESITSLESAAFTFLVPAGSVHDPENRQGLSGFTCEMVLRGAGPRDSRQFIESLENLGVERSESVSEAHTSFSGATLKESLYDALSIYADLLRRPHLPADQLDMGRQVMMQELHSVEDDPHHKVMLELRRHHYPYPWGRPSQGNAEQLEMTRIEDVRQHFQRYYDSRGAILGIAGNFDWKALVDHVGQLFGDWTGSRAALPGEGASLSKRHHLPMESNQTQIGIAYQSVPYADPNYFRAWGAVGALSGGMSSRLFTEVREKRGLCYSVYATSHTLKNRGSVLCYAGTSADRAQETLEVMLDQLVLLAQGIQQYEIDRLKARIKSSLIMQQESSSARSSAVARDWYHLGRVRPLEEIGQLVDDLTCEQINAYLTEQPPHDFTVVTLGPQPLEIPLGIS